MTITKRQLALGLGLILLPALAWADGLNALGLLVEILSGVVLLTSTILVVTILAYRRPDYPWLRWLSWLLTGVTVVAGIMWQRVFNNYSGSLSTWQVNPFLALCLPLALWLNGVWYAQRVTSNWPRMVGLAVAVQGLSVLIGQALNLLMTLTWDLGWSSGGTVSVLLWALGMGLLLLAWRVVLRQVQQREQLPWADWPQLATTAGVYVGFSLLYSLAWTWLMLNEHNVQGGLQQTMADRLPTLLLSTVLDFGVTVLALWWDQRRRTGQSPAL